MTHTKTLISLSVSVRLSKRFLRCCQGLLVISALVMFSVILVFVDLGNASKFLDLVNQTVYRLLNKVDCQHYEMCCNLSRNHVKTNQTIKCTNNVTSYYEHFVLQCLQNRTSSSLLSFCVLAVLPVHVSHPVYCIMVFTKRCFDLAYMEVIFRWNLGCLVWFVSVHIWKKLMNSDHDTLLKVSHCSS